MTAPKGCICQHPPESHAVNPHAPEVTYCRAKRCRCKYPTPKEKK